MTGKRVAVVGAAGQLGADLVRGLGDRAVPLMRRDMDVASAESVRAALAGPAADAETVINCAAYNFVDRAEDEPQAAYAVNALGPRQLALACAEQRRTLVHVSSDFVFGLDTSNRPWRETDPPGPVSAYGMSKLAGEYFVRAHCPRHFVVRTCGLYGNPPAQGKGNFVRTMLRLGRERGAVTVVNDQHCTPTSTADLADAICDLIATEEYGLYHATNAGATTWYDFAVEIFRLRSMPVNVTPTTSLQFNARARRPTWSVLDCGKLERLRGKPMPDWRASLERYLADLSLPE